MITATGLARTFKTRRGGVVEAVKGVDISVAKSEIVGFLGPNGAGKTTTLRMLTTLLEPTAGTATVAGCDLRSDPVGVRRRIGYISQSGVTFPEARAGEEVVDRAMLYGLSRAEATSRGRRLFAQLDLEGLWERNCKSLSGGQRRRLDIVIGLIHEPLLVFLDEPTAGLDPQSRANLWEHIRRLNDEFGTTVLMTTHYLDEADALSDRVMVIDHGSIVATGTPAELKRQVFGDSVRLTVGRPDRSEDARRVAATISGATETLAEGSNVSFRVADGGAVLPNLLRMLDAEGVELSSVEVHRPSLDDVFLSLTGRSLRDAPAAEASSK